MKKAVCFGINDYGGSGNLNGCVNDMNDWKHLLQNLGFEVSTIQDHDANRNRFLNELTFLIAESNPGDHIVITYSGHGTQVYDHDGDEGDGYDEALYLYDGALVDDDIRDILSTVKDGVILTFVADSCFSGTVLRKRSVNSPQIRFYPTDTIPATAKKKKDFLKDINPNVILLSGCSDNEYSYDAHIDGRYNGAFTYYATKEFEAGIEYAIWHDEIRKSLPSDNYPQSPQLEGATDKLIGIAFDSDTTVNIPDPEPTETTWWKRNRAWVIIISLLLVIGTLIIINK